MKLEYTNLAAPLSGHQLAVAQKLAEAARLNREALRRQRIEAFLRNRPDADRYVLAQYKAGFK